MIEAAPVRDCAICLDPVNIDPEQTDRPSVITLFGMFKRRITKRPADISGAVKLSPCEHEFHAACIQKALECRRICPTCRQLVRSYSSRPDLKIPSIKNIHKLLATAIDNNRLEEVKNILSSGEPIPSLTKTPNRPLRQAIKSNYFEVAELLINKSTVDDAEAFHDLALRYLHCHHDASNKQQRAFELVCKAKEQGLTAATRTLGCLYFDGIGVNKNHLTGFRLLTDAAKKGDTLAGIRLGIILFNGEGQDQPDFVKSFEYFQNSASEDYPESIRYLAFHYHEGLGVKPNHSLARQLFKKTAFLGDIIATQNLSKIDWARDARKEKIDRDITLLESALALEPNNPETLYLLGVFYTDFRHDYSKGVRFLIKACDYGSNKANQFITALFDNACAGTRKFHNCIESQLNTSPEKDPDLLKFLGVIYQKGIGTPKNLTKAHSFFKQAADQNDIDGTYRLARLLIEVGKTAEASKHMLIAAGAKMAKAQSDLGLMYLEGNGVSKDPTFGVFWLESAARQNNPVAQHELARLHLDEDEKIAAYIPDKAYNLCKKSALSGYAAAQRDQGLMALNGVGTQPNLSEAITCLKKASIAGDEIAKEKLLEMNISSSLFKNKANETYTQA
ncbi:SEL1-like repeat protein [Endozoicomonas ascidiicola]|uniref:SEL1-like repeat protein n=1 Tax=Endozoicomonas ascidiicola TaxID=1698521 RepID=UPI000835E892|nr:SEL1-like repeat protein [Endozoicomonas ascidiicola]